MIGIRDLEKEISDLERKLKKCYQKMEQAEEYKDIDEYNYWSHEASEIEFSIEVFKYLKEKYCS